MIESLIEHFATLDDPRCAGRVEHRPVDVSVIAVCAVIADAATLGCSIPRSRDNPVVR